MNKQSNTYTIIYIIVLVTLVGAAMAFAALSLKPLQTANADADKMKQILMSVNITPEDGKVIDEFNQYITDQYVIDAQGNHIDGKAFDINVANESKLPLDTRKLPVYVCTLSPNDVKYILPVYGAGLWGPIWGYISIDADGSTIYGAYFAHQGETPGLGAEIEKPAFSNQFKGLHLFKENTFMPINVLKAGQQPQHGEDAVDAISGGTITSKGVASMIDNCLTGYKVFLEKITTSQE
jgi:Na+-transporting NADH:ubiquinone oxidoreductase subunit C